ncbi:FliG C-terminal domain-containing protein [Desulfovibrio gilichinskyi]|uniref:FliG C-terminal domain-containing protein n=1 Tax=Desulfovibrio gilichinskyi TaxID=1519643 RepID=A0A1X7DZD5_9BACT|nr:FliG C-terminal domain-containing protein [Desulfovibrio gilichinskyi]SMF24322.1 FliG C-terminal domain-containing protein [Desulfovibrio gilichinskyi]
MIKISDLKTDQRLESLTLMPDYYLQEVFTRDISNETTAKILAAFSDQSREIILSNLNKIRREKVSSLLHAYAAEKLPLSLTDVEQACEALLDRVEDLVNSGFIRQGQAGDIEASFFDMSAEMINFSDSLPIFNFNQNDLHDLISWWNLAAKNNKSLFGKKPEVQNLILERLDDVFSSSIFRLSIDDNSDAQVLEESKKLRSQILADYKKRTDLIETFLLSLSSNQKSNELSSKFALFFSDSETIKERLIKHAPLLLYPSVTEHLPPEDIAMSLFKLKLLVEEKGHAEMEKFTQKVDDQFLRKGLSLIFAKIDDEYLQKILSERKKAYTLELEIKLKMITDAVICIRNNVSPYILLELMSSYTVYDFQE